MTPDHIAMLIAAPIIILIILWAPLLDFIGPPCVRFLQRRRRRNPEKSHKARMQALARLIGYEDRLKRGGVVASSSKSRWELR
jgi:hypothetical protein